MLLLETFSARTALPWYAAGLLVIAGAGIFYWWRTQATRKKTGGGPHGQLKAMMAGLTVAFSLLCAVYALMSWYWLKAVVVDDKGITLPGLELKWEEVENAQLLPGAEDGSPTLSITHHQQEVYVLPGNIYPTTAILKAMQSKAPKKSR